MKLGNADNLKQSFNIIYNSPTPNILKTLSEVFLFIPHCQSLFNENYLNK